MPFPESRSPIDFGIRIDFDRDSRDPARIFRAMSSLITSFQQLDYALIGAFDVSIEPILMLEDVESGSLLTWLRESIMGIDDEALRSGEIKKIAGQFLVKGKYLLLRFLEDKESLSDRGAIIRLQQEIIEAAEEAEMRGIPIINPVPIPKLLAGIKSVNESLSELNHRDKAMFISANGDAALNPILDFSLSDMEDLLTREVLVNEGPMILKVKKPDYLGTSKWEFLHEHAIDVKIQNVDWLGRFQKREVDVRPGDALRAVVISEVRYGYEGDVIGTNYTIIKVIEIVPFNPPEQLRLHD